VSVPEDRELRIRVSDRIGEVSALLRQPPGAKHLLALAHGAGADMRHAFLAGMAAQLAAHGIATLRYQFPYTEAGRRRPDPPAVLEATVRGALAEAARLAGGVPLLAGGKSMGGRMTSRVAAEATPEGVRGLVFLGFPLHPAGRPSRERAAHLFRVQIPMLFLQGTRDRLAELDWLRPLCRELGTRAVLCEVEESDHSFRVPRRLGQGDDAVQRGLADEILRFAEGIH
jgi:predicted alpha/beta-hydrolase family hydrolase